MAGPMGRGRQDCLQRPLIQAGSLGIVYPTKFLPS